MADGNEEDGVTSLMMPVKAIPLPGGGHAITDPEDWPRAAAYHWYIQDTHQGRQLYVAARDWGQGGRIIYLHRLLTGFAATRFLNGDRMDCRRSNLREASQSQKQAGIVPAKRHATSRFKGVSKRRNGWIAQIMHNRRNTFLGLYGNEEDAARAYDKKALEIHGEFAVTNETLGLYGKPGPEQPCAALAERRTR